MTKRVVGPAAWPPAFASLTFALLAALVAGGALSCHPAGDAAPGGSPAVTRADSASQPLRPLSDVLRDHAPRIMALPGVVGVGEAALPDGRPCLRIFIERRTAELDAILPRTIEGWPVDVEVSGAIRAMDPAAPDSAHPGDAPR